MKMPHWPMYLGPNKDLTHSLDRVKTMLEKAENPHKKMNGIIHITGTNGKGSTANYIANIISAHGLSVNLYTSPHIYECNERIVLNGKKISDEDLYYYTEKLRIICEKHNIEPTIFEATTVVAFMAFSKNNANFNVIEVGMGGTNDATNVFEKSTAVFTPIDVDHSRFLGSTPIMNAIEKSGIIKNSCTIVSAPQNTNILDFLKQEGVNKACNISLFGENFNVSKVKEKEKKMIFELGSQAMLIDRPSLIGEHQLINAGVAIATVLELGIEIDSKKVSHAIKNTCWPVRMEPILYKNFTEILPNGSRIFMDGAHNVSGAKVVADFLKTQKPEYNTYIINGRTKNTDSAGFLSQFLNIADAVFAVRVQNEALSEAPEIIVQEGKKLGIPISKMAGIPDAIHEISLLTRNKKACVVLCGSLYLARDIKKIIN